MARILSFLNINSSGDLEGIPLKDVCSIEIENKATETCYVETSASKSFICSIASGSSRQWSTDAEDTFTDDAKLWIHFADSNQIKAEGTALVMIQKRSL